MLNESLEDLLQIYCYWLIDWDILVDDWVFLVKKIRFDFSWILEEIACKILRWILCRYWILYWILADISSKLTYVFFRFFSLTFGVVSGGFSKHLSTSFCELLNAFYWILCSKSYWRSQSIVALLRITIDMKSPIVILVDFLYKTIKKSS